ncbi:rod-binding protein [Thalassoglobus sp. JC818]|uniref:rod-binding protein n=1 Tax=Thalassoglobus sp. JC818 TaxID=3232136 RepID=UPI003459BB61
MGPLPIQPYLGSMSLGFDSGLVNRPNAQAGVELESLLISTLLKEMRQASGGGLFEGDESDTLGGMFDRYLSQFLAEQGGIGLTETLTQSLAIDSESKSGHPKIGE